MNANDFVDYYELLELSPNASFETVERVFRYLATLYHPDFAKDPGFDKQRFSQIIEAFEALRDPEKRADYDALWQTQQSTNHELVDHANAAESDCRVRAKVLSIFYGQRRKDIKKPGVSVGRIEDLMGIPSEVLSFHLWYFREQAWIAREESGVMSITAKGVDQVESSYKQVLEDGTARIEHRPLSRSEAIIVAQDA